jgi:uncharacterized protein
MESKLINDTNGQKTYALIFDSGDEVVEGITDFAKEQQLSASQFTAIGAFSEVMLGYFDFSIKDYKKIPIHEQVEVLTLVGDIAMHEGKPKVHAHVVVGKSDGTAHGGHVLEARVKPTLEVILTESPAHLQRKHDKETGLALIAL